MRKLKNYCRISFGENIFKNSVLVLALILMFIMISFTGIDNKSSTYYIPKNMAYVSLKNNSIDNKFKKELDDEKIKYYQTIPIGDFETEKLNSNPLGTMLHVSLNDLQYSKYASIELIKNNQEKIDYGMEFLSFGIQYNLNNKIVSEKGINLPNEFYNINSMIVGNYPKKSNEVLISDSMANYYLSEKGMENYSDLIGEEIEIKNKCSEDICSLLSEKEVKMYSVNGVYKISGVYKPNYSIDHDDNFIINPTKEIENLYLDMYKNTTKAYYLEAENFKELEPILSEDYYSTVINYKDVRGIDYGKILEVFTVIIFNIIIFFVYKSTRVKLKFILYYYGYSRIKVFLINLIPFIIFNFIILVLHIYI